MQPNHGSIKPAELMHGLLILLRSGQNSGWKMVLCGVHMCGLEQKNIRMDNRVSCSNQLRTEGESKREGVAAPCQSPLLQLSAPHFSRYRWEGLGALSFCYFHFTISCRCLL